MSIFLAGGRAKRISIKRQRKQDNFAAFVISGGDDIHPSLYGGEVMEKATYDRKRDELEMHYIKYALQHSKPLLGICRGFQLLNVVCGGSLYPDIRPMRRKTTNRAMILARKPVRVCKHSKLASILGKTRIRVNSLHHQAINQLGDNLSACAYDADNFIQAIESTNKQPLLGVQWHPEYLLYKSRQRRLFRWLIKSCH
ncbi:peptidase C26 [Catenovulum agarivorans DS-2]|uniref:Peptidase C26 n=1 Tax=Catenovulum agarivorans DS-2 TaxID=1328313 RepID=W7QW16_9ALTE|nr:peptidase C26 [Catenovulum agarivorans DS-2]